MFEKEAEEIANKRCHEIMCFGHCSFNSPKHHRCGEWHREYNCVKEGIEYGYNKGKEWYEKIKSGKKTVEYREVKPYWIQRLSNTFGYYKDTYLPGHNPFFEKGFGVCIEAGICPVLCPCILRLGYTNRYMTANITKIAIVDGKDTDLHIDKPVYAIHLANVHEGVN